MSDQVLRSKLIRLASEKPDLRAHLLPLLRQSQRMGVKNAANNHGLPDDLWGFPELARKSKDIARNEIELLLHAYASSGGLHRYVRPPGRSGINPELLYWDHHAWGIVTDAINPSEAARIGVRAQRNLIPHSQLHSSDQQFGLKPLFVIFQGGEKWVRLPPLKNLG